MVFWGNRVLGSRCRVSTVEIEVQGLGIWVAYLKFRIKRFKVHDSGSGVQGSGFRVQGSGFRV
jgi:hypothetical protein